MTAEPLAPAQRAGFLAEWERRKKRAAFPAKGEARKARADLSAFVHSLLASDCGAQQPLLWYPIGTAIPPGWRLARQQVSHHSVYSQLIERMPE